MMGKTAIILLYLVLFVAEIMFIASISALTYVGLRSETSTIYFYSSGILLFLGCIFNFMLYCYWDELGLGQQLVDIGAYFIIKTSRIIYFLFYTFCTSIFILIIWCAAITLTASLSTIENKKEIINMKSDTLIPNKDFNYSGEFYVLMVFFVVMFIWSAYLARATF